MRTVARATHSALLCRLQARLLPARVQQRLIDEAQLLRALDHGLPLCPQVAYHCIAWSNHAHRPSPCLAHRQPFCHTKACYTRRRPDKGTHNWTHKRTTCEHARIATGSARSSIRVSHSTCCGEKLGCAESQLRRRRMTSMVMYVPVRPTPALQCTHGTPACACRFCTPRTRSQAYVPPHNTRPRSPVSPASTLVKD